MLFFAFFSRVCFLLPKLPQYKLGCKGTKKCAHTQASEHILSKKIDFIYHIITLPLTRSLLMREQVGVIIRKAKPYFRQKYLSKAVVWAVRESIHS